MQNYDLAMLAVLGFATIFGFWKGLAWQIASLASLVVSYFAALKFADRLAPMVSEHAPFNKFAAMLIIYAGSSLAIWMLFRVVAGVIDGIKLKEFDRQMGALVGFAKGVLICIAITCVAVTLLGPEQRDKIIASRSGHYIVRVLDKADAVAPPEIQQVISPYIERINKQFDPNYQPNPAQDFQDIKNIWSTEQAGGAAGAGGWPSPSNFGWPSAPNNASPSAPQSTPALPISTGGERL